jgi:hypothetical protein
MPSKLKQPFFNKRREPRHPYSGLVLFVFLIVFLAQQPAFSQTQLNGRDLLKDLKEVNGQILETRIKLGEALIEHLKNHGNDAQSERMRSIYRLSTEYQNFCDCEQRALLLYIHTKETVKVYLSAYSRDIVRKKKKDLDESLKNLKKYSDYIDGKNTLEIVTKLQSQIKEAQSLINQIIQFYATENATYKQGNTALE